jgi:membrane dipeptidase
MKECVRMVREDILSSGYSLILSKEDLTEDPKETMFLMTVEGMCGIHDNVKEKIQWLYDQGNRIGSLEWNDQNDLATGNSGDPARGLTGLGRAAVRRMNELHMIIDVSHANEKTFWDLMDASELPLIATHSNAKSLCTVERNLTNQQIRALTQKGGLIGMNACESFISDIPEKRTARTLAAHARYIADLAGIEHVACGFDFGAYYGSRQNHDLHSPEQTQNFIEGLKEEGFSEDEIKDIAYRNVLRFLKKYM